MLRTSSAVLVATQLVCCKLDVVVAAEPGDPETASALHGALVATPAIPRANFPKGFFASSAATVKFTRSEGRTFSGVVFANGSDWGPQPLTMYSLTLENDGYLEPRPHWVSEESGYHTGVCAGDLDGKFGQDVVVTALGDGYGAFRLDSLSRSIKIYTSSGDSSPGKSFNRPANLDDNAMFNAVGCDVADIDGDGVAEVLVGEVSPKGYARLYSRGTTEAPFAQVRSIGMAGTSVCNTGDSSPLAPGAARFALINDDLLPDLVVVGKRLAVFFNTGEGDAAHRYPQQANWCSKEEIGYSPSVEFSQANDSSRRLITVSQTCMSDDCEKKTAWLVYDPLVAETWVMRHELPDGVIAGPAVLMSMRVATGDNIPDLVGAIFYDTNLRSTYGFPLQIFAGQRESPNTLASTAIEWEPQYRPVASRLLPVNLLRKDCEDLFVISQHPANPSTIFPEVGNCNTK